MKRLKHIDTEPIAIGAGAIYPFDESILEQCARVDRFGEPYNLARVIGAASKRILVPRNLAHGGQNLISAGISCSFNSKFVPRNPEQARVVNEVVQLIAQGESFVIEAPTGFGKTVCAMDIIAKASLKTLVVVTKEDIRDQWRDAASMVMGLVPGKNGGIGYIQGDTCQITGKSLVIALIQSLAKEARYNENLFKEFGLVIWDESGAPDTLVTTSKGQIRLQDLVRGRVSCDALSLNTDVGVYEWKRIVQYHEHPPKNPMMRVTHDVGYLDFTSEHLFYTDRGWVPVKELNTTDFIYLDVVYSKDYHNSKSQEGNYGSMDTRNSFGGCQHSTIGGWDKSKTSLHSYIKAGRDSIGKVFPSFQVREDSPKEMQERWLGGGEHHVYNDSLQLASSLLSCHLLQGGAQNPSAITCNASMARVVSLVDYGRWGAKFGGLGASTEQVSRKRCSNFTSIIENLFTKWSSSESQRLVYSFYQRVKQIVKAGACPALHSVHDVQVRWSSFWRKDRSMQSMRGQYSDAGRGGPKEGILSERDLSESKEVYELPSKIHSPIGGGEAQGTGMGQKVRVLSVEPIVTPEFVYDIEVEGNHNFVANGVLVHNCHRVGADFFSQSAYRVPAAIRIGLSATPDRKDGRDEVIRAHIGPIKVWATTLPLTPKIIARRTPWRVPMTRVNGKVVQLPHSPGKCGHVINLIARSFERNKMIAMFVGQAFKKGRNILVQSDRKDHLEELASMITSFGVPPAEIGYYIGGLTEKQRDTAKGKSVIMATYAMTAEATDIPWLDTLVMATPKSDVRQIVGRILRQYEGKKSPIVFDLVDLSSNVFSGYWNTRRRWYATVKAEVDYA